MCPGRTRAPPRGARSPLPEAARPRPSVPVPQSASRGQPRSWLVCLACPWGWTPTPPKVPKTPFLLLYPSHDSVLRNVPRAKGTAQSHEMNAFPSLSSHSFPKRQGHLCLLPLPTQGLNPLPDSTYPPLGQASSLQGPRQPGSQPWGPCLPTPAGAPKVWATSPSPFYTQRGRSG